MKNTLIVALSLFYIACGGSAATQHRVAPAVPRPEEWHSYYNEAMDMTVLITDLRTVRYRVQPPTLRTGSTKLFASLSTAHLSHRLTETPEIVSFNLSMEDGSFDIPGKLLLINVPNGRWIKVEADKIDDVYVAVVPLASMEQFLDAERNGVVGFMGDSERFLQFAVNADTLQLFKRFMTHLHDTASSANVPPPRRVYH